MKEGTAPARAGGGAGAAPEQVNIILTKSDDQNSILVVPGKFYIHVGDQVEWRCQSDGFSVDFNGVNGSPFGTTSHYQRAGSGSIPSGLATKTGNFKYTVTVDGNVLDPNGQVDP